jgi:hypothetical protein
MPQGHRTLTEKQEFKVMLPNFNILYLGGSVLALMDLSYSLSHPLLVQPTGPAVLRQELDAVRLRALRGVSMHMRCRKRKAQDAFSKNALHRVSMHARFQ